MGRPKDIGLNRLLEGHRAGQRQEESQSPGVLASGRMLLEGWGEKAYKCN